MFCPTGGQRGLYDPSQPLFSKGGVGIVAELTGRQVISGYHAQVGRHRQRKMAGETPHPRPLSHWEMGGLDEIVVGVRANFLSNPGIRFLGICFLGICFLGIRFLMESVA